MAKVLDCNLEVSKFDLQLCYYIHFQTNALGKEGSPYGVMAKVLSFVLKVSKFKLQTGFYVHFQTNIFGKAWTTLYL